MQIPEVVAQWLLELTVHAAPDGGTSEIGVAPWSVEVTLKLPVEVKA